jgi:hypothetical protein
MVMAAATNGVVLKGGSRPYFAASIICRCFSSLHFTASSLGQPLKKKTLWTSSPTE